MGSEPSEKKGKTQEPPKPEVLKPQADRGTAQTDDAAHKVTMRPRRVTYRPSHKATFIGLGVVVAILALNAGIIAFVMRSQGDAESRARESEIILSSADLDKLGVSRNPVGNLGTELVVGPNARFNGKLVVGSDMTVAGRLQLNSRFSASDASLTKLEAGDTSLGQLNVNGDGTANNLNARRDLSVAGTTRLQGPVTMSQLLTVNNNASIIGNLSVGGTLTARGFQASSLISDTTLLIGGHIVTRGFAPGVSKGGALVGTDTVSISGSDTAGTVAVNIGVGSRSGIVANVSFRQAYGSTPRVVVTAIGPGVSDVYVNRNANGFSIGVGSIGGGGHAFDYIVMQ